MKKVFKNNKLFLIMVVVGFVGSVSTAIYHAIPSQDEFNITLVFFFIFEALCLITLYVSYINHSKNVMKGIMGALLATMVLDSTCWLNTSWDMDTIFSCISIFLNGILFVNHFIINNDHHSKPTNIRINQITLALISIVYIIWNTTWAIDGSSGIIAIVAITDTLHCIGVTSTVVNIETRLDAYKIDREKAGWIEENYPKGNK